MRYYFDIIENGRELIDEDGDDLGSDDEVMKSLRQLLGEQAKSLLCHQCAGELVVTVRDSTGPRFRAKLSASVE